MIVEPFNMTHFTRLQLQPEQRWLTGKVTRAAVEAMTKSHAFAVVTPDRVLCCCGVAEVHDGRGVAWALCADNPGALFQGVHRAAKRVLEIARYRRIEATVPLDFTQGHRWMRLLGFVIEAPRMIGFGENGEDHTLYRWQGGLI